MVKTSQGLNKHVAALIPVLVTAGDEKVKSIVEIEIVMAIEMAADKVVELLLRLGMEVLEFVNRGKLRNVETIREDAIRLPLKKVLTLESRDVRNRREHVAAVSSSTLNAVTMIDSALSGFRIHVEILEVVVEVYATSTEVTSQESGMRGEDRRDVDSPLATQRKSDSRKPFVKVGDDRLVSFATYKLRRSAESPTIQLE